LERGAGRRPVLERIGEDADTSFLEIERVVQRGEAMDAETWQWVAVQAAAAAT
jgi:hypothetical protein